MIIDGTSGNTFTRSGVIDSYIGAYLKDSTHTIFRKCGFVARGDGFILDGSTQTTFIDCGIANTDYPHAGGVSGGSETTFTNCNIFGGVNMECLSEAPLLPTAQFPGGVRLGGCSVKAPSEIALFTGINTGGCLVEARLPSRTARFSGGVNTGGCSLMDPG
ncbi:right-handed parallel beta-helix repeat-containing protein [Methanogenium cariaci]|uniref:right-handed parallel beta-helix repeat-containing protein n=1 Tax=Methanogenium cariaci TaxID=2197 RepID=UPI00155DA648|nr:right-handed parallel beta-helix repeat-containing protein [Methanogenium cariaci]